jgi:hypothetical protein
MMRLSVSCGNPRCELFELSGVGADCVLGDNSYFYSAHIKMVMSVS